MLLLDKHCFSQLLGMRDHTKKMHERHADESSGGSRHPRHSFLFAAQTSQVIVKGGMVAPTHAVYIHCVVNSVVGYAIKVIQLLITDYSLNIELTL